MAKQVPHPYHEQRKAKQRAYDSTEWRKTRLQVLSEEPLCRVCQSLAAHVDHIDGDNTNNDRVNLQPICAACHQTKTRENTTLYGHG